MYAAYQSGQFGSAAPMRFSCSPCASAARFKASTRSATEPHILIIIGLIAQTCIEATVRFAAELGYEVTVVKDATADYSDEMMHAALDINMPNYANAIVSTDEIVASISALTRTTYHNA
jgi:isochorismate hydrolase